MNDEDQKISKKSSISTDKFEYVYKKQDCMCLVADFFSLSCAKKITVNIYFAQSVGKSETEHFFWPNEYPIPADRVLFSTKNYYIFLISP